MKQDVKSGTHWRDIVAKDETLNAKISQAMATEVANFEFEELLDKTVREKLSEFMHKMRFEHVRDEKFLSNVMRNNIYSKHKFKT